MQITSTGIISLPSVTTSMIDGDTTGKAIVTKEYLSASTAASNYWTKIGNDIANSNTGKILLFGSDYTNAGPGLNIVGSNSTSYGGNTANKAIINFVPNPLGTPDNNVVSGIQSQDVNQGNVRAGIYFQAEVGNAGRPAIVFRTGSSLTEALRIGQNGIINATSLIKYNSDLSTSYDDRTLVDKGYIASYTTTQLASKMNNPSLTASYIPKALTATTIGNSRIVDTDTYLGIGTVNAPTKDITLGNQANREIGVELSSNTVVGRDLKISSGSTINYIPDTGFLALPNSNVPQLLSIATAPNGDVLAMGYGGSMYLKTPGIDAFNFISGSLGADFCKHIITPNNDVYVTSNTGSFIKKQTNRTGSFITVATGSVFTDVTGTPSNDVWACSTTGVFKQTNATGSFVDQGFPVRAYQAITSDSTGKIYVAVYSGDIYEIVSGVMTALNQTYNTWSNIKATPSNNVIATTGDKSLYTRTSGVGNFIASAAILPFGADTNRSNLAVDVNSSLYYVTFSNGPVYFQNNDIQGTSNLSGGTVNITAGTGKGTGASNFEVYTGQKLASGTDMQTSTLRARINNEGLMTLPSVTNALIEADTTGKAVVTKEYLALSSFNYIQNFFIDTVNGNDSTGIQGNINRPFKTIDAAYALFDHDVEYNINKAYTLNLMTDGTYYVNVALIGNNITINSSAFCIISFENNTNAIVFNTAAFAAPNLTINAKQSKIVFSSTVAQRMNVNNLFLDVSEINSGLGSERYLFSVVSFDVKVKKFIATSGIIGGGTSVSAIHTINKIVCPNLIVNYTAHLFSYNTVSSYSIYDFRGYIESTGHIIFNANGHSELLLGNLNVVSGDFVLGVGNIQFKVAFYDSIISGIPFLDIGSYANTRLTLTGSLDATSAPLGGLNYDTTGTLTFDNFKGSLHSGFNIGPYNLIVRNSNITTTGVPFNRDYWVSGRKREFYGSNSIYSTNPTVIFGGNYVDTIDIYGTLLSNITSIGLGVTIVNQTPIEYPSTDNRLVVETTSGYTLTNADSGGIVIFKTTAAQTLNIPTGLADGFECTFVTLSGVTLTVPAVVGITLNNATYPTGSNTLLPQLSFTLKRMLAANTYIATGSL